MRLVRACACASTCNASAAVATINAACGPDVVGM